MRLLANTAGVTLVALWPALDTRIAIAIVVMIAVLAVALIRRKPERPNALAVARCWLFHRKHWGVRRVGLTDHRAECTKCGRAWWVN